MIQLQNQIPEVYYNHSRDFQLLGRLFDAVLNAVKTNADMVYHVPNGIKSDTRSTDVLARTLGFTPKHSYDQDQLEALVSIFPTLLKYKGTVLAIKMAGDALIRASSVQGDFIYTLENNVLTVVLPYELTDISLFLDLLPYILPAGISCNISRGQGSNYTINTKLATTHSISAVKTDRLQLAHIMELDIADNPDSAKISYTFKSDFITEDPDPEKHSANTGLVGNTMIISPNNITPKISEEESN